MQELKDLKDALDEMMAKITVVVDAGGRAESRAQAAWDLIREHISAIADEAGVPVGDLQAPAFQVWLFRCKLRGRPPPGLDTVQQTAPVFAVWPAQGCDRFVSSPEQARVARVTAYDPL